MWALGTGPSWAGSLLKRGGTVILLAPCPDGVAKEHPDVLKYGYLPYKDVSRLVEEGKIEDLAAADHIARSGNHMHEKALRPILVSEGVSREEAEQLHLDYVHMEYDSMQNPTSAQRAVEIALERHGQGARFYVYPGGTFAGLLVER